MDEITNMERRIDPDPVSILVGIVGVVGSFASIAGYLENRSEEHRHRIRDEPRKRAELVQRVAEIESALSEIDGQFQKLQVLLKLAYNADDLSESQNGRLSFGNIKPIFRPDSYKDYVSLHIKVSTLSTKAIRATYLAIALIDELGVEVSERVFSQLLDLQQKSNQVLSGEITFLEAYFLQLEVIDAARRTADRMRDEFGIEPEPHDDNTPRFM